MACIRLQVLRGHLLPAVSQQLLQFFLNQFHEPFRFTSLTRNSNSPFANHMALLLMSEAALYVCEMRSREVKICAAELEGTPKL